VVDERLKSLLRTHPAAIFRTVFHAGRAATVDENGGSVADRPQQGIRCFPHSLCIFRAVNRDLSSRPSGAEGFFLGAPGKDDPHESLAKALVCV